MNISIGQQEKYYINNKYYKYDDSVGKIYYGASEVLSYHIAHKLGIDEHIQYWLEFRGDRVAAVSDDFCLSYPRQTDLWSYLGDSLTILPNPKTFDDFRDKLQKLADFTSTPIVRLMYMLWDDLINLNVDRHFGNITLLCNEYGMTLSPLYDFGQGWLVSNHYITEENVDSLIHGCTFEPFNISYDKAVKWYSKIMPIPVDLKSITSSFVLSILERCAEYYPESYLETRYTLVGRQIELLREATET